MNVKQIDRVIELEMAIDAMFDGADYSSENIFTDFVVDLLSEIAELRGE